MPIFEFTCNTCSKKFELLLYSGEKALCPHCKSEKLSRMISRVSLGAGVGAPGQSSKSSSGSSCSSCSSGNCSHC